MIKLNEIANELNKIAPLDLAEDWDNSGFQIFLQNNHINKILVCLDITDEVIEEAINAKVDLIVSHHPMYFNPMKNISSGDLIGNYTIKLLQNGISVYSSHTPFDKAPEGTNFYLANLLEMKDLHFFDEFYQNAIGIYGLLSKPLMVIDFVREVCKTLNINEHSVRVIGDVKKEIQKIGICTGAGMSELVFAQKLGCDLFITGDIKYHEALEVMQKKDIVIDVGHFDSEKFFVDNMSAQLEKIFGNQLDIIQTKTMVNPFQVI